MKMQNKSGLKEIGKRTPYTVPENYFGDFALQMDKIIGAPAIKPRFVMAPWMYVAAMIMGLFVLVNVFYKIHQNNEQNNENYELYVMTQTDDMALADYYLNSDENEQVKE